MRHNKHDGYDEHPSSLEEDLRHDDHEYNPAIEPKSAKAWINLLTESEKAFDRWNDACDRVEREYANLEELGKSHSTRAREYQMFWANCEVIRPSIYARPPVPVVVPKFKDRRPVYQAASEVAERCATVAFDLARINDIMIQVRDDLALIGRGVAWCRYESAREGGYYSHEKVCVDFKHRRDFLHSISRTWQEVSWVAAASYLTQAEARERFFKYSGDEYKNAEYKVDRDTKEIGGTDNRARAKFWEIWHRGERRVVWVAEGCENILDEDDPHLDLLNFFPCPKPAYGTVQPGSLVPVPDMAQYRDQLDEVNLLTDRIHALSEALEAKGFYPAGGGEMATAIEAALHTYTPGRVLVPISNWAAFGGSKEVIVWMPIEQIAQTIQACVALRKEIVNDIYQIMGLSDIMRGATNPNETLGAQQLKSEYGSVRIRDKQQELVRLSRDLVEISLEIIFDKFADKTIIEMSQTELPTKQMAEHQINSIVQDIEQKKQQLQMMMAQPGAIEKMQQNPQMVEQGKQAIEGMISSAQKAIKKIAEKPTLDQVLRFLRDERIKSFVLDIETDSTIQATEDNEKKRRMEFVGVLAQLLPQMVQMISAEPRTAEFAAAILKFATAPFRAGRPLDASIDALTDLMEQKADQQKPDDPATMASKTQLQIEQMKNETQKQKMQADAALEVQKLKQNDDHKKMELVNQQRIKQMELRAKEGDDQGKLQVQNLKAMENREAHQAHMLEKGQDMQLNQQKAEMAQQLHQQKQADMANRASERQAAAQFKLMNPPGGRPS